MLDVADAAHSESPDLTLEGSSSGPKLKGWLCSQPWLKSGCCHFLALGFELHYLLLAMVYTAVRQS